MRRDSREENPPRLGHEWVETSKWHWKCTKCGGSSFYTQKPSRNKLLWSDHDGSEEVNSSCEEYSVWKIMKS